MKYRFNKAQLERDRLDSLEQVVAVMQSENQAEIEVSALEFPDKLSVKLDSDTMVLTWDAEKKSYSGSTIPEPELEPEPEPGHGTLEVELPGVDPVQLAQRTYDVIKDNLSLKPGQREIYHETLCNLWLKEV